LKSYLSTLKQEEKLQLQESQKSHIRVEQKRSAPASKELKQLGLRK
jgi:hypothetical protein